MFSKTKLALVLLFILLQNKYIITQLKRNVRASHGCLGRLRKDAKSENCMEGTEKYRYPKGETSIRKEPSELKHLSSLRKINQKRFRK